MCVDDEVGGVNVVALHDHLENFRLVHRALLHELDHLVLHCDCMVNVVVKLDLELVLELSVFLEEVFIVDGIGEVLVILSQQVHLAVVGPGVEPVTHWVLSPYADILASSKEQKSMDFLVEGLPVENVGHPGKRVGAVQEGQSNLPGPHEWVHEEEVPREGHQAVVHAVWVLKVDR